MTQFRIGWPNPLGVFITEDGPTLHRTFSDLSRHLSYPLVGVRRAASQTVSDGDPISWDQTVTDQAQLVNGSDIRCPRDFQEYLAWGVAAQSGVASLRWAVNGTATIWPGQFAALVRQGDVLSVQANDSGTVTEAEAWLMFLPMH